MDKNCKNCLFRERSYSEYPCEKCRNGNNWTPSDNLLEFAIEELEKTKEIFEDCYNNGLVIISTKSVCDTIERRISKLKGDSNEP